MVDGIGIGSRDRRASVEVGPMDVFDEARHFEPGGVANVEYSLDDAKAVVSGK